MTWPSLGDSYLQNETLDHTNHVGVHYNAYSISFRYYYASAKRVWSVYALTYDVGESYQLHHT